MISIRVVSVAVSSRKENRPMVGSRCARRGHGLGDRDGVHGDVMQAHHRHGLLFNAAQVSKGQLCARHSGEEVGRLHDEPIVDAAQTRIGATRSLEEGHERISETRVGAQLQ